MCFVYPSSRAALYTSLSQAKNVPTIASLKRQYIMVYWNGGSYQITVVLKSMSPHGPHNACPVNCDPKPHLHTADPCTADDGCRSVASNASISMCQHQPGQATKPR